MEFKKGSDLAVKAVFLSSSAQRVVRAVDSWAKMQNSTLDKNLYVEYEEHAKNKNAYFTFRRKGKAEYAVAYVSVSDKELRFKTESGGPTNGSFDAVDEFLGELEKKLIPRCGH